MPINCYINRFCNAYSSIYCFIANDYLILIRNFIWANYINIIIYCDRFTILNCFSTVKQCIFRTLQIHTISVIGITIF